MKRILDTGREMGLATLVTASAEPEASQVKRTVGIWLKEFRTAGLDGWALRFANESRAGKRQVQNYAGAQESQMDRIVRFAPEARLDVGS